MKKALLLALMAVALGGCQSGERNPTAGTGGTEQAAQPTAQEQPAAPQPATPPADQSMQAANATSQPATAPAQAPVTGQSSDTTQTQTQPTTPDVNAPSAASTTPPAPATSSS